MGSESILHIDNYLEKSWPAVHLSLTYVSRKPTGFSLRKSALRLLRSLREHSRARPLHNRHGQMNDGLRFDE